MEIANFVSKEARVSAMTNIFMKPHQIKVASHFKKLDEDSTKNVYNISIDEATDKVLRSSSNSKDIELDTVTRIRRKIDDFLKNLILDQQPELAKK